MCRVGFYVGNEYFIQYITVHGHGYAKYAVTCHFQTYTHPTAPGWLSLVDFDTFLFSRQNEITLSTKDSMHHALNNYWINSSHNTYLLGELYKHNTAHHTPKKLKISCKSFVEGLWRDCGGIVEGLCRDCGGTVEGP